MLKKFILMCMVGVTMHVQAQKVPHNYKRLIEEAYKLSKLVGNQVFNGYHESPFTTLLITDSTEFLFLHPRPTSDFINTGDSLFSQPIYERPAKLNKHLLATFPAVNGVSSIVTGTPENTEKSAEAWVITLLHEHFHQYQHAQPGYFQAANDLNLSNGDNTGMWMLNYPFPYDSLIVQIAYAKYTSALYAAVNHKGKRFNKFYRKYLFERKTFLKTLRENDIKYFSFQLWQEGIARYAEYALLKKVVENAAIIHSSEFRDGYRELLADIYKNELNNLKRFSLKDVKRIHFYSAGFAEALLLDKVNPDWRQLYKQHLFSLDHLFPSGSVNKQIR